MRLSQQIVEPSHEPDLSPDHKAAVLQALRWAWGEICRLHPAEVANAHEEVVTNLLQRALNECSGGKRCASWLEDFEAVSRGAKVKTSDGRIEKQPDLHFRPPRYESVVQASDWLWAVECKIIDPKHSVNFYCDQGVRRFCEGEYSAWMPSAAMLAYVRDKQEPFSALDGPLQKGYGLKRHDKGTSPDNSQSAHDRSALKPQCVDIELTHLWLAVAPGG